MHLPISRVLAEAGVAITPNTYYAAKTRRPTVRSLRNECFKAEITRVSDVSHRVYGVDKIWAQLDREGIRVACCTVERLMRQRSSTPRRCFRAHMVVPGCSC
jgi:putative transposase